MTRIIAELYVFVLAAFVGYEVITRVPHAAHAADVGDQRHLRHRGVGGSWCWAAGEPGRSHD